MEIEESGKGNEWLISQSIDDDDDDESLFSCFFIISRFKIEIILRILRFLIMRGIINIYQDIVKVN